jgi:programmed cell death 6-interacting protein
MDVFVKERKEDSRIKHREKKLQEMELAYWKWREVIGNCQEGSKVSRRLLDISRKYIPTPRAVLHCFPDNATAVA